MGWNLLLNIPLHLHLIFTEKLFESDSDILQFLLYRTIHLDGADESQHLVHSHP